MMETRLISYIVPHIGERETIILQNFVMFKSDMKVLLKRGYG